MTTDPPPGDRTGEGPGSENDRLEVELPPPTHVEGRASPVAALLAAVQFLLISPAFIRRTFTDREMGASVGFYPLVGLLLGALLVLLDGLLGLIFPQEVRTTLTLTAWVILTGALHLDGFLDACDGLLGGFTPERRLEIMRDERRGAYALAGGILLLLLQYTALVSLAPATITLAGAGRAAALLLGPTLGRWGMALAVILFPYGRASGLGKVVKEYSGPSQAALATLIALVATVVVSIMDESPVGVAAAVVALAILIGVAQFSLKRIPGMTGDLYGAICILIETGVLLAYTAAFYRLS